jgi:hypothetical protein
MAADRTIGESAVARAMLIVVAGARPWRPELQDWRMEATDMNEPSQHDGRARSGRVRQGTFTGAVLLLLAAGGNFASAATYTGTLTLTREGPNGPLNPGMIVDYDIITEKSVVRFDGIEAHRTRTGEIAYLSRLAPGHIANFGVVAADARGVPSAPLYVCIDYNITSNRDCHAPKLSPDGRLVAFGARAGGGKACKDRFGVAFGDYVIVRDRHGSQVASFEGYYHPEWLPDGRLLILGSPCRGAGVWIVDRSLRAPMRVDGGQVAVPASFPAVHPNGSRVALVWNNQLWALSPDGRHDLTQLTQLEKPAAAAAWSPDGTALAVIMHDVSLPVKALVLFRPGDERSLVVRQLPFYPYGPISWH